MGSQGRPGGFVGEPGDVTVGLVELRDGLGSNKLFGCDMEAVGITLNRLEQPAAGLLSSRSKVLPVRFPRFSGGSRSWSD